MEITIRQYLDIAINFEHDISKLNRNWGKCKFVR